MHNGEISVQHGASRRTVQAAPAPPTLPRGCRDSWVAQSFRELRAGMCDDGHIQVSGCVRRWPGILTTVHEPSALGNIGPECCGRHRDRFQIQRTTRPAPHSLRSSGDRDCGQAQDRRVHERHQRPRTVLFHRRSLQSGQRDRHRYSIAGGSGIAVERYGLLPWARRSLEFCWRAVRRCYADRPYRRSAAGIGPPIRRSSACKATCETIRSWCSPEPHPHVSLTRSNQGTYSVSIAFLQGYEEQGCG